MLNDEPEVRRGDYGATRLRRVRRGLVKQWVFLVSYADLLSSVC